MGFRWWLTRQISGAEPEEAAPMVTRIIVALRSASRSGILKDDSDSHPHPSAHRQDAVPRKTNMRVEGSAICST